MELNKDREDKISETALLIWKTLYGENFGSIYDSHYYELLAEKEEARDDGISIGRDKRNIEIAKKLLDNGISDELILKSTDISKEKLDELKKL